MNDHRLERADDVFYLSQNQMDDQRVAFATRILVACVVACLPSCSRNAYPPASKKDSTPQVIESVSLSSSYLVFGDVKIAFPTSVKELTQILGEPRREKMGVRNSYIWDDCGFTALTLNMSGPVVSFSVFVESKFFFKGDHLHPKNAYIGQIHLPDLMSSLEALSRGTDCTGFKNSGFIEAESVLSVEPIFFAFTEHENGETKTRFSIQTEKYHLIVVAVEHDFKPDQLPF